MKDNGSMIRCVDKERRHMLMETYMKVNFKMEMLMVRVHLNEQMETS